jgi:recombinational DNA repair protein (RecF pathway)
VSTRYIRELDRCTVCSRPSKVLYVSTWGGPRVCPECREEQDPEVFRRRVRERVRKAFDRPGGTYS